jgi:hypothetical protein
MERRDGIINNWASRLMTRAFRDLAASFAVVDAPAADRAIHEIEATIAAELDIFLKKLPKGVVLDRETMMSMVGPLRDMTQGARALIQQTGKPAH